jgi:hypothetical protein
MNLVNEIYNLSEKLDNDILEKFSFSEKSFKNETHETKCRKLMTIICNASYYIATNGKIGEATNMIISKENYEKYSISHFSGKFEILFEDINDIFLYRKNQIEEPFYNVESIGFYTERQIMKIKLT